MTKGLPASGKSTWAKAQCGDRIKRINKDDLRDMLDNGTWSKTNEKHILQVRDMLIDHYLSNGFSVIVDDTNLHPKHEKTLREIAEKHNADFEVESFMNVPLATCIERDLKRPKSVGERVIKSMYNKFLKPKPDVIAYKPQPFTNPLLPHCLIVDIDGTLAHMDGRSPYDYSRVHEDIVDERVREVVWRYAQRDIMEEIPNTYIIIVSGRTDDCKSETTKWLKDNQIPFDELHMRKSGDMRNDSIVKYEIYEEHIKPRFNVRFVLDDRDRVVKMWRQNGLKVLQVAEGDF
jgi:predicted kinase/cellobiose-specific phosphotransferase system component IIB